MANIKSAAKRARQNIVRGNRNRRIRSMLKTSFRRFEESLSDGDMEETKIKMNNAIRQIDKAQAKGVIHKNNAARKKSRINRIYNQKTAV